MKTLAEIKSFFDDALGANAVIKSPDSERPYIRIAEKNGATLFMNVDFGKTCYHPGPDEKLPKHFPAVGVVIRFFQQGGDAESFSPPLKVRDMPTGLVRLSKHEFPLCPIFGTDPKLSWKEQDVTPQLVDWVKGIGQLAGCQMVSDAIIRQIVELALESLPDVKNTHFFTLDVKTEEQVEAEPKVVNTSEKPSDPGAELAALFSGKKIVLN